MGRFFQVVFWAQTADKRVTHSGSARGTASVKAEAAAPEWAGFPNRPYPQNLLKMLKRTRKAGQTHDRMGLSGVRA
jgi:hypothetical protein